ncbi:agamous-like MADS-box protein AGL61 [Ipomoea triloba]|uniref:agamous-like MADS-box protein AGL61 n=1 Tax=Ipomoea triloba TaxID=35885 RepID=UPI00125CD67C|nr:agamous-like MADS-box protein AGL61 [Ipomoea triloba]
MYISAFGERNDLSSSGIIKNGLDHENKDIESDTNRNVTSSKRRNGLIKKANVISTLCGVKILLVIFSPSAQPNSVEQNFRTHREAVMQILSSQITYLEMKIEEEMKINQALREAEKVRPPISELSLSELQSMKHNIDMLRSHVVQKLMKVHAQAKIAQIGSGSFFGYS